MAGESTQTSDHDEIRRWAEERGGRPARVEGTAILRIDFRDKDENLEEISWDDWFRIFDESNLAFLHQDKTADGKESRFNKLVEAA